MKLVRYLTTNLLPPLKEYIMVTATKNPGPTSYWGFFFMNNLTSNLTLNLYATKSTKSTNLSTVLTGLKTFSLKKL